MTIEERVNAAVDENRRGDRAGANRAVRVGCQRNRGAGKRHRPTCNRRPCAARRRETHLHTDRRPGRRLFVTDRSNAERYRYSAAYLEGIALEEGRTVYAKDPERALAAGEGMVRRTLYDPDKAVEWLEDARDRIRRFATDEKDIHKCESLVDALERALKALIVASGRRVAHRHGLDKLWTQAEAITGRLPAGMTDAELKQLTKYTGEFLYPAQGARELDARSVWKRFETPIGDVVEYAERRVPELVKDTLRRIESEG